MDRLGDLVGHGRAPSTLALFSDIHTLFTLPTFYLQCRANFLEVFTPCFDCMGRRHQIIMWNIKMILKYTLRWHATIVVFVICFHSECLMCAVPQPSHNWKVNQGLQVAFSLLLNNWLYSLLPHSVYDFLMLLLN
jgi:hypothetical protein